MYDLCLNFRVILAYLCVGPFWVHLGVHLGSILGPFRVHFGSFWVHFGSILGPFWFYFGSILVPFWVHFGSILGLFWVHFGFWLKDAFSLQQHIVFACVEVVFRVCVEDGSIRWAVARDGVPSRFQEDGCR